MSVTGSTVLSVCAIVSTSSGRAISPSPMVMLASAPVPSKYSPPKPGAIAMNAAVGLASPQPRPYAPSFVVACAISRSSSHVMVSPVGISTPASSSIVLLANTM